jgi:hypothetical protein
MHVKVVVNNHQDGSQSISVLDSQTNHLLSSLALPCYWALGEPEVLEDASKALFATGENEVFVVNLQDPYNPTTEIWQRKLQAQNEQWLEFQ